jgi:hypothetical protein
MNKLKPRKTRQVMPVTRKYTATVAPQGLKRPGAMQVDPRKAAAKASS